MANQFRALIYLLAITLATHALAQNNVAIIPPNATEETIIKLAAQVAPTPRQLRWQQLELTAFFHFGINTFTNKEWGDGKEEPALFNPTNFDATQWIRVVKDAGIKQVILTAKHHDGFCLWPSKFTKHSVASSPWRNGKGDVVKEVAKAANEAGIGFGVYLSPWDRNYPLYGTDAYNDFFVNQLTELLTQYGQVDEVWFDGANGEGPNGKKQVYDFERWYALIRKLQPQAVIAIMGPDVRWVGTETGHGRETEWSVVPADNIDPANVAALSQQDLAFKPTGDMMGSDLGSRDKIKNAKALVWYPAETDVSIRPGWFYHPEENDKVKSPEQLTDIYFNSVGRNGVLLLNIPPDTQGELHKADVAALIAWRTALDSIFTNNLIDENDIAVRNGNLLLDKKDETDVRFDAEKQSTINITLNAAKTFSVIALQENIRHGQRIESFTIEYEVNGKWQLLATGTTVGYKRLIPIPATTAQKIRINLIQARDTVHLAEIGLFYRQ